MLRRLLFRATEIVQRRRLDDELDEEIRLHLELAVEEYESRGYTRAEAERAALRDFGPPRRAQEGHREVRGLGWIEHMARDLAVAFRGLVRRPGFTVTVAATLGLGVGATTAVYSVVDGVIIRPLPYANPAGLVTVGSVTTTPTSVATDGDVQVLGPMSMPNFVEVRKRARSFDGLAALEPIDYPLTDQGMGPEMVAAARITDGLFGLLGVMPALGRAFLPDEYSIGAERAVMLGYGAWQRMYGGDPAVVGRSLDRAGVPTTIVGVLPEDFVAPEAYFRADEVPELWFPLPGDHNRYQRRTGGNLLVLGRLREGATVRTARLELGSLAVDLAREYPTESARADGSEQGIGANSLHAATVGTTERTLLFFFGASGLLLGLSALNAAMLFLARTQERRNEIGTRAALGAGRGRIVSLLVAETTVLSLIGGAIGVGIAHQAIGAFRLYAPATIPRLSSVGVDARLLAVAAALTLLAGILAGLLPALRFTRRGEWARLQGVSRSSGSEAGSFPRFLVGGQTAAAVLSLVCAALLFSSFMRVRSVDPGFEASGILAMRLDIEGFARSSPDQFTSVWAAWDLALEQLAAVPGVEDVAGTSDVPYSSPTWSPRIALPGDAAQSWREGVAGYAVTANYLATMGTRVVGGRGFDAGDGPTSERVALVNESFVRNHLDGAEPLGLILRDGEGPDPIPIRIVGIVEDVVQARPEDGIGPAIYRPYSQVARQPFAVVRSSRPLESIVPELRVAVARFNPIVPPREIATMVNRMSVTRAMPRFQALLMAAFAAVSILIAAAGLYSSLAHAVGRRRHELAVRMALGADRSTVHRMVLRQGMTVSTVGLAIGLVLALVVTRSLAGALYNLEPHDPVTLAAVAGAFLLVSLAACLGPALRATRMEPASLLRGE